MHHCIRDYLTTVITNHYIHFILTSIILVHCFHKIAVEIYLIALVQDQLDHIAAQ